MDCNMRSPLLWDWENLIISNPSKTDNDHKQLTTTGLETEKGEGLESTFPCFDGMERLSNISTTSLWHSTAGSKSSQSNIDFVQVKKTSTALEASAESDLCLKLGKRTYSEERWSINNSDVSKKLLSPSVVARKKSKSCGQSSMQAPRCQVDGCELDLSSAKEYHRKHRVCEAHSKCPKVTVSGVERRFCQQCSRLHAVSEFDEKKRSCRKRLSHHNARRRKSQGAFPSNVERVYDQRHHTSIMWNGSSLNTKSEENFAWDTTYDTKPTQTESGFTLSFHSGNGSEEQLFASSNHSLSAYQTSGGFSAGKTKFQLRGEGFGEHTGVVHQSEDLHHALSLLSTYPHAQPLSLHFSFDGVRK